MGLHRKGGWCS